MLTGTYQQTHRMLYDPADAARLPEVAFPLPDSIPLISEILQSLGYTTLSVTDGGNIGAKFGFGRGFDQFDDQGGGIESGGEKLLTMIDEKRIPDRPLFLFFHTYEVHSPYDPPESYASLFDIPGDRIVAASETLLPYANNARALPPEELNRIRALYDAEIRLTDDALRHLFDELRRRGILDEALIVVTSDHGEEFGEHNGLLHRDHLYDELLHVPLIVAGNRIARGRSIDALVSTVDIAPSILAYLGAPIPEAMEGRPLLVKPASSGGAVFSQYGGASSSVRTSRWKLVVKHEANDVELYDLPNDPAETLNVADMNRPVVHDLMKRIDDWKQSARDSHRRRDPVRLSDEEIRKLNALGYAGGRN